MSVNKNVDTAEYNRLRKSYLPKKVRILLIAESPPPSANIQSSRHFYRSEIIRQDDRLFVNTIKALYPEAASLTEKVLEQEKTKWLNRFCDDGYYMIEALDETQPHEVTKHARQEKIAQNLPSLIKKVSSLANKETGIILIKSNVFEVAAKPLRDAGFTVLNTALVDYPGRYVQRSFREKLAKLTRQH